MNNDNNFVFSKENSLKILHFTFVYIFFFTKESNGANHIQFEYHCYLANFIRICQKKFLKSLLYNTQAIHIFCH